MCFVTKVWTVPSLSRHVPMSSDLKKLMLRCKRPKNHLSCFFPHFQNQNRLASSGVVWRRPDMTSPLKSARRTTRTSAIHHQRHDGKPCRRIFFSNSRRRHYASCSPYATIHCSSTRIQESRQCMSRNRQPPHGPENFRKSPTAGNVFSLLHIRQTIL